MSAKYLVIDVSSGVNGKQYPVSFLEDVPDDGWTDEYKTDKIVLRHIQAGEFMMSDPGLTGDCMALDIFSHLRPRKVRFDDPFYIGVFPITQRQWSLVMGDEGNPSKFRQKNASIRPVDSVLFEDIRGELSVADPSHSGSVDAWSFLGRLRDKSGLSDLDIPTEAQWEYASNAKGLVDVDAPIKLVGWGRRGGSYTYSRFKTKAIDVAMDKVAWFRYNEGKVPGIEGTHPVGGKQPNGLGLYDMHGNVAEWCSDGCSEKGWVLKGGHWCSSADDCFAVMRSRGNSFERKPYIGVRLCCNRDNIDPKVLRPISRGISSGRFLKWTLPSFLRNFGWFVLGAFPLAVTGYGEYLLFSKGYVVKPVVIGVPLALSVYGYFVGACKYSLYGICAFVLAVASYCGYRFDNWNYTAAVSLVGFAALYHNAIIDRYVLHTVILYTTSLLAGWMFWFGRWGVGAVMVLNVCVVVLLEEVNESTRKWWRWMVYAIATLCGVAMCVHRQPLWGCVGILGSVLIVKGKGR